MLLLCVPILAIKWIWSWIWTESLTIQSCKDPLAEKSKKKLSHNSLKIPLKSIIHKLSRGSKE